MHLDALLQLGLKRKELRHIPQSNTNLRLTVGTPDIKITMAFCCMLQHTNILRQDKSTSNSEMVDK